MKLKLHGSGRIQSSTVGISKAVAVTLALEAAQTESLGRVEAFASPLINVLLAAIGYAAAKDTAVLAGPGLACIAADVARHMGERWSEGQRGQRRRGRR